MATNAQATLFTGIGTGAGTALNPPPNRSSTIRLQILLTSTGTVNFEHTVDGTNWTAILATNDATGAAATSATAAGIYAIDGSASFAVRPNVAANGSGITITGTVVDGGGGAGGSGGGAVTVADGADVTLGAKADAAITDWTQTGTAMAFLKGAVENLNTINTSINAAPSGPLAVQPSDGTNVLALKAASTAVAAGDVSFPVGLSPNSPLPAGTNHLGEVGGNSLSLESTLTVSTTPAYSAGDNVGGLVTLTNAMRISGGTGVLQNLLVVDHSHQNPNLDIIFFTSTPAATFTDNGAFPTLSQADDALVLCRVSIASTDWVTIGGSGFASPTFQPKVVHATGSANLLMAINTSSTPTFGATTDIMVTTGFLRD